MLVSVFQVSWPFSASITRKTLAAYRDPVIHLRVPRQQVQEPEDGYCTTLTGANNVCIDLLYRNHIAVTGQV